MKRKVFFKSADLFCGLGGFSQGAEESGYVETVLAVNHWRPAAYSFQANHQRARVICARIDDVDPRNDRTLPDLDMLFASPECTHHSIARGGQPVEDQKRATPWHVVIWTECKRPKWVAIENVREFRDWGPLVQKTDKRGRPMFDAKGRPWMIPDPARKGEIFRQWLRSLASLGYKIDHQVLNAADYGAPTTRQRLFIIAKREDVRCKDIPWPEPTHGREQWRSAASIIDWSIPSPSIFDRKRPLAPKTLRRLGNRHPEVGKQQQALPRATLRNQHGSGRRKPDPNRHRPKPAHRSSDSVHGPVPRWRRSSPGRLRAAIPGRSAATDHRHQPPVWIGHAVPVQGHGA